MPDFYVCALVVNQAYKVVCEKSHMPVVHLVHNTKNMKNTEGCNADYHQSDGTIEPLRLEKTTKIGRSNCQSIPTMPTHDPQCHNYSFPEYL